MRAQQAPANTATSHPSIPPEKFKMAFQLQAFVLEHCILTLQFRAATEKVAFSYKPSIRIDYLGVSLHVLIYGWHWAEP